MTFVLISTAQASIIPERKREITPGLKSFLDKRNTAIKTGKRNVSDILWGHNLESKEINIKKNTEKTRPFFHAPVSEKSDKRNKL
jgi:hypothetical protein